MPRRKSTDPEVSLERITKVEPEVKEVPVKEEPVEPSVAEMMEQMAIMREEMDRLRGVVEEDNSGPRLDRSDFDKPVTTHRSTGGVRVEQDGHVFSERGVYIEEAK